jgi:hypothetical protein
MNNFYFTDMNLLAVIVSWKILTASGLLWFQPELFGNEWSNLTGKELKPEKKMAMDQLTNPKGGNSHENDRNNITGKP